MSCFCSFWCCLCAPLLQTWYLFCETAAEDAPASPWLRKSPRKASRLRATITFEGSGQDGTVVLYRIKRHTAFNTPMKAFVNDTQGLSKQLRLQFDRQPISETDRPSHLETGDGNTSVPAADRRCLLKRETATLLQNSVPPDQEDILN